MKTSQEERVGPKFSIFKFDRSIDQNTPFVEKKESESPKDINADLSGFVWQVFPF